MKRFMLCLALLLIAGPAWGLTIEYGNVNVDASPPDPRSVFEGVEDHYHGTGGFLGIYEWGVRHTCVKDAVAFVIPIPGLDKGHAARDTVMGTSLEAVQHASGFTIYHDLTLSTEYWYDYGFDDHNNPPEGFTPDIGYGYGNQCIQGFIPFKIKVTPENPAGSTCRVNIMPTMTEDFFSIAECLVTINGELIEGGFVDVLSGQEIVFQYELNLTTAHITEGAIQGGFTLDVSCAPVPLPAAFWLFGSGLIGLVGLRLRKR